MTRETRRNLLVIVGAVVLAAAAVWYGVCASDKNRSPYDGPAVDNPNRYAR